MHRSLSKLGFVPLLGLSTLGLSAQQRPPDADTNDTAVVLHDDLGTHTRTVSTSSSRAQAFFDQGLRFQYAFNHPEAIRSYREALRADPDCAMCWWGVALASGHNINAPGLDPKGAREAAMEARKRSGAATPVERALIDAIAVRYADEPSAQTPAHDSAYARALEDAARRFPGDPDILTFYGAALMNLSPWNYWSGPYGDRSPRAGTERILDVLGRAVAANPEHPGACHYYIHLVEAAFPERAVACAERLANLMPGAGHIVHMPGHIYIRVGRYADAVRVNEHAVHADETMMADMGGPSLYTGAYYPHNYHFMAFAATMAGMKEKALEASRTVAPRVPLEVARDVYWIQNAVVLPQLTLLTFGEWRAVLDEPMPAPELEQATLMALYARGTALAALGRSGEAQAVLSRVVEMTQGTEGSPEANPIPHIAPMMLRGEIALRAGRADEAVEIFERARDVEDSLLYDEPPLWYRPVRHTLGQAYLDAGRPADAERAYRDDLDRFPANGWSLRGLALSLKAQGRTDEAARVEERFRAAWREATIALPRSHF